MEDINKHIVDKIIIIDNAISKNIQFVDTIGRGLVSTNVLSHLRNLIEHILVYGFGKEQKKKVEIDWEHLNKIDERMRQYSDYAFILKFHRLLQISESHYTQTEEDSERLMISYYEYLIRLRNFVNENFGFNILDNLGDYPLNLDDSDKEYYLSIIKKIEKFQYAYPLKAQRFYVQKRKAIIIDSKIIYEIILTPAVDRVSKFDRIVAYSKTDIPTNYAISATIAETYINEFGKYVPISIIDTFACSIRPCELKNYSKFFGLKVDFQSNNSDYKRIMQYLSSTSHNLSSLVETDDKYYNSIVNEFGKTAVGKEFVEVLNKSRNIILKGRSGSNILRYLLYTMKNQVLKDQYYFEANQLISNLYLDYGCIPFDTMPLTSSLKNHNPSSKDLYECINLDGREHEYLSRMLLRNAEIGREIYTDIKDINFDNIEQLVEHFNNKVYYKHLHRRIEMFSHYLYIKGYEDNILEIIQKLQNETTMNIGGYESMAKGWVDQRTDIDDENKRDTIKRLFVSSRVALVYGAAGTGKTTLLKYVSELFEKNKKIFVANTNPAVELLKRRINDQNSSFMTVAKAIRGKYKTDLLILDECSTISNYDMIELLKNIEYQAILLVGDTYQIESIQFGNWFSIIRFFLRKNVIFELTNAFRTKSENLLDFWSCIRQFRIDEALTKMTAYGYNNLLDETLFIPNDKDEIILCLNYDGIYGVNNLNRIIQSNNHGKSVKIGINTYKVNDPVLFNDSNRFSPIIFNNNKGIITNLIDRENDVYFEVELDKLITEIDVYCVDGLSYIGNNRTETASIVGFYVDKNIDSDDDSHQERMIPFQIAYAVSIHKAQGLEYSSVKIVVSNEVEEDVTHNIFYTAITRSKEKLKIYWSPEVMNRVFAGFNDDKLKKDANILAGKYKLKMHK